MSSVECTGISARWCPNHGDCRCPDGADLDDRDCPLHGGESDHGDDMKTTTLLEVMAEVSRLVESRRAIVTMDPGDLVEAVMMAAKAARNESGSERGASLKSAAAWAILALHAHDAEAAKAGT